jgi:hypothetical protein
MDSQMLSHYRIIKNLGEGGMGEVSGARGSGAHGL